MKKIIYLLSFTILCSFASAQVFWTEDFETDGEGDPTRYTSSNVFNDGSSDHYGRTDGSNITGGYLSPSNTWFMAGEDLDDNGGDGSILKTTTFAPQVIAGMTDVRFSGLFAFGTSAAGGWDFADTVFVQYRVDAGPWTKFLQFASVNSGSNVGVGHDTNLDGTGNDLTNISNTFNTFTEDISVSGSTIQLRLVAYGNSANEEFAYDLFTLDDITGAPPTPTMTATPSSITGLDYLVTTSGPSASQSGFISASNLSGVVTGVGSGAIGNFEFSLDNLVWTAAFPGPLPGAALNVAPTTVFVRLVAGLPVGLYNATITLTNTGGVPSNAAPVDITLSGEVFAPVPTIILNEFQADPSNDANGEGDANGDGTANFSEDEFVEFYNTEAVAVDMSGWTISDAVTVRHTFPSGSIVPAGGFMTVFGGGDPLNYTGVGGVFQAASTSSLGLNNGGDIITLATGSAQVVTTLDYNGFGNTGNNQSVGRDPDFTGGFVEHANIVALGRLFSPGENNVSPPSSCSITSITAGQPSACAPATNTYSVDITVTYSSPPATGNLEVNGQSFAVTTSPQTVTLTNLPATGADVDVTAVFEDDGTCTLTQVAAYTAPSPCIPPLPSCALLFISEYIEGSSSNKCLELYNPTDTDIDMAADGYSLSRYNNGSTTDDGPWPLSGIVPAYGTYVICNSFADPGFVALADTAGGFYQSATFYNGDDVIALTQSGNFIDVIGQLGNDPGSAWSNNGVSTANQTLVRMASIQSGDNVESDIFDPADEWNDLPTDDFSNLGQHNSDCAPFVWTGLTSTDYHTGSNWTKGTVPTALDHAWIPSVPVGGVFPIANADVDVADLTIRSGGSLNIAPTFGLIFSGTANNSGTVTLESSAAGTAWMDDFSNPGATWVGEITVQTFVSAGSGLGQRYFGSPVVAGTVTGLDATYASGYPLGQITPLPTCDLTQLAPGSAYSNLFQWNEDATFSIPCVQEGWEAISEATVLTPGRGYSGWLNDGSIISITGVPNTGDVIYNTSGVSSPALLGATGWHVLSNPFPSPMDAASVTLGSSFSSVQVYNGASGPFSGSFFPAILSGPLAVGQGFVAEAFNPGNQLYVAFESFRLQGNAAWQRPDFGQLLSIDIIGNGKGDQSFVYFSHDATDQFDIDGDCKKRQSDAGYPTLFTINNGNRMSLNGLSSDNMNRSIDLGLLPGSNGSFEINFDGLPNFPATTLIFLEDKLTGDFVNLRENSSYEFIANEADDADRFVLHFTAPVEITSTNASCDGNDAEMTIDFGQYTINNQAITWDYNLSQNSTSIADELDQNGQLTLGDLDKGTYNLELQYESYILEVLVEIDGADKVNADFEDPIAVEEGTLVNLANLSTGAILNSWTVEGQNYMSQDLSHVFITPGLNEIVLDASNADCSASAVKVIEVYAKTTGIKDAEVLEEAVVYAQDNAVIVDLSALSNSEAYTLTIFNLLGQVIEQAELTKAITRIELDENGNYFIVQLLKGQDQKAFKVLLK